MPWKHSKDSDSIDMNEYYPPEYHKLHNIGTELWRVVFFLFVVTITKRNPCNYVPNTPRQSLQLMIYLGYHFLTHSSTHHFFPVFTYIPQNPLFSYPNLLLQWNLACISYFRKGWVYVLSCNSLTRKQRCILLNSVQGCYLEVNFGKIVAHET